MNWKFDFSPETSAVMLLAVLTRYKFFYRYVRTGSISAVLTHDGRCALWLLAMEGRS